MDKIGSRTVTHTRLWLHSCLLIQLPISPRKVPYSTVFLDRKEFEPMNSFQRSIPVSLVLLPSTSIPSIGYPESTLH